MRCVEERPQACQVAGPQRRRRLEDPGVLGEHVAGAAVERRTGGPPTEGRSVEGERPERSARPGRAPPPRTPAGAAGRRPWSSWCSTPECSTAEPEVRGQRHAARSGVRRCRGRAPSRGGRGWPRTGPSPLPERRRTRSLPGAPAAPGGRRRASTRRLCAKGAEQRDQQRRAGGEPGAQRDGAVDTGIEAGHRPSPGDLRRRPDVAGPAGELGRRSEDEARRSRPSAPSGRAPGGRARAGARPGWRAARRSGST